MTFVNKQQRAFRSIKDQDAIGVRSDGRIKRYSSALDTRAWCASVEQRRQHILEHLVMGRKTIQGNLVPLPEILNLFTKKERDSVKRLTCVGSQLINEMKDADLSDPQRESVEKLKKFYDKLNYPSDGDSPNSSGRRHVSGSGSQMSSDDRTYSDDDEDSPGYGGSPQDSDGSGRSGGKGRGGKSKKGRGDDDDDGTQSGSASMKFVSSRYEPGKITTRIKGQHDPNSPIKVRQDSPTKITATGMTPFGKSSPTGKARGRDGGSDKSDKSPRGSMDSGRKRRRSESDTLGKGGKGSGRPGSKDSRDSNRQRNSDRSDPKRARRGSDTKRSDGTKDSDSRSGCKLGNVSYCSSDSGRSKSSPPQAKKGKRLDKKRSRSVSPTSSPDSSKNQSICSTTCSYINPKYPSISTGSPDSMGSRRKASISNDSDPYQKRRQSFDKAGKPSKDGKKGKGKGGIQSSTEDGDEGGTPGKGRKGNKRGGKDGQRSDLDGEDDAEEGGAPGKGRKGGKRGGKDGDDDSGSRGQSSEGGKPGGKGGKGGGKAGRGGTGKPSDSQNAGFSEELEDLMKERDDLAIKLNDALKELQYLKTGPAKDITTKSCLEELKKMERDLEAMKRGDLSAEVLIQKQIQLLSKCCEKLNKAEAENKRLGGTGGSDDTGDGMMANVQSADTDKSVQLQGKSGRVYSPNEGSQESDVTPSTTTSPTADSSGTSPTLDGADSPGKASERSKISGTSSGLTPDESSHSGRSGRKSQSQGTDAPGQGADTAGSKGPDTEILIGKTSISSQLSGMQTKMNNIDNLMQEKEVLAEKVKNLERELEQYKSIPGKLNDYQNKCGMLTKVLEDRDKYAKQVMELQRDNQQLNDLKKTAGRASELESQLNENVKNSRASLLELTSAKSKVEEMKKALRQVTNEKEMLACKVSALEGELCSLRSKAKENELLRVEKDCLELKMNEFAKMQEDYDCLLMKSKDYDNVQNERDLYRAKYEELVKVECQCDMLRAQVDAAKVMGVERDELHQQIGEMQANLYDKEKELIGCKCKIEQLTKSKDEDKCQMQSEMASIKAEIDEKNYLIAASEDKITSMQSNIRKSILDSSDETVNMRRRIDCLEKELTQAKATLAQKTSQVKYLQTLIKEKEGTISSDRDSDMVCRMKKELEAAKAENKKLQEIANKMVSITGDEHVQQMLKQSECAVKRVVEELGRQYQQWDTIRNRNQDKEKKCGSDRKTERSASQGRPDKSQCATLMSHLTKFKERVCELESENAKLRSNVDTKVMKKSNNCYLKREMEDIMQQKENLEKQLRAEMNKRVLLEQKLKTSSSRVNCNC